MPYMGCDLTQIIYWWMDDVVSLPNRSSIEAAYWQCTDIFKRPVTH